MTQKFEFKHYLKKILGHELNFFTKEIMYRSNFIRDNNIEYTTEHIDIGDNCKRFTIDIKSNGKSLFKQVFNYNLDHYKEEDAEDICASKLIESVLQYALKSFIQNRNN